LDPFETLAFLFVDVRLICHDEALELGSGDVARVDRMEASLLHVGQAAVADNPELFKSTLGNFGIIGVAFAGLIRAFIIPRRIKRRLYWSLRIRFSIDIRLVTPTIFIEDLLLII